MTCTTYVLMNERQPMCLMNEQTPSRRKRDNQDENALFEIVQFFNVFQSNAPSKVLQNVTTKDLATAEIQKSLPSTRPLGKEQL